MKESLFTSTFTSLTIHTPREAYFFIPNRDDQLLYDPKKPERSLRLIFDKVNKNEYLAHENENYEKFMKFYNSSPHDFSLPDYWTESETRKCIQASNWDYQKALAKMKACIEYPIPDFPFSELEEIISSGFVYMHGLDINYRPILCVCVIKFVELIEKYEIAHFVSVINLLITYLSNHFFIPGQVENWVMIADVTGVSMWKPPTKILKVFDFLMTKYLCKLSVLYIYGMNYILNMCWKVIKPFIDERTTKKFVFISGNSDIENSILKHVHPSQLEKKYGGDAENISSAGGIKFPFILPSNKYQIDERNNNKIIDEEQYIKMVKENKLVTLSPYLIQENKIKDNQKNKNKFNNNNQTGYNENASEYYWGNVEFYECDSQINGINNNNYNNSYYSNYEDLPDQRRSQVSKGSRPKLKGRNKLLAGKRGEKEFEFIRNDFNNGENGTTSFEYLEKKASCCKCTTCCIF